MTDLPFQRMPGTEPTPRPHTRTHLDHSTPAQKVPCWYCMAPSKKDSWYLIVPPERGHNHGILSWFPLGFPLGFLSQPRCTVHNNCQQIPSSYFMVPSLGFCLVFFLVSWHNQQLPSMVPPKQGIFLVFHGTPKKAITPEKAHPWYPQQ